MPAWADIDKYARDHGEFCGISTSSLNDITERRKRAVRVREDACGGRRALPLSAEPGPHVPFPAEVRTRWSAKPTLVTNCRRRRASCRLLARCGRRHRVVECLLSEGEETRFELFCRRCEASEIHVRCRGKIGEGRPHGDRLAELLRIDLVERVVCGVMGVEIIHSVLAE